MKKERECDLQERLVGHVGCSLLPQTAPLLQETDELIAILLASVQTAKGSKER